MAQTNMDNKNNPDSSTPVTEFTLMRHELQADMETGDFGTLLIPVEVIDKNAETVTFRKAGRVVTQDEFRTESLDQMRERIGTVEDNEMPMKEDESEEE